jgi:hypothetical protein
MLLKGGHISGAELFTMHGAIRTGKALAQQFNAVFTVVL